MMIKNKKVEMRIKFKNFIFEFCYLKTNFQGHLKKNKYYHEKPSFTFVFTHVHVLYIFHKIEKI